MALLAAALVLTVLTRPQVLVGVALLGLVLVPLERAVPLKRQRVLRPGLVTDLTHLLLNTVPVAVATVALVVATALPFVPLRRLDLEAALPGPLSATLAAVVVLLGSYWGHRLTHQVPFLWRFHAVHHSIEHMDWLAAARLHPLDAGFTQACFALPLFALGYDAGLFAGVAVVVTRWRSSSTPTCGCGSRSCGGCCRRRSGTTGTTPPTPRPTTTTSACPSSTGSSAPPTCRGRSPGGLRHPRPRSADSYLAQLRYSFARSGT